VTETGLPATSKPSRVTRAGRRTTSLTPGMLRHPSGAASISSDASTMRGFTSANRTSAPRRRASHPPRTPASRPPPAGRRARRPPPHPWSRRGRPRGPRARHRTRSTGIGGLPEHGVPQEAHLQAGHGGAVPQPSPSFRLTRFRSITIRVFSPVFTVSASSVTCTIVPMIPPGGDDLVALPSDATISWCAAAPSAGADEQEVDDEEEEGQVQKENEAGTSPLAGGHQQGGSEHVHSGAWFRGAWGSDPEDGENSAAPVPRLQSAAQLRNVPSGMRRRASSASRTRKRRLWIEMRRCPKASPDTTMWRR
jgi:hypothetical protein